MHYSVLVHIHTHKITSLLYEIHDIQHTNGLIFFWKNGIICLSKNNIESFPGLDMHIV